MNYEAECVTTHERGQGEVEITWAPLRGEQNSTAKSTPVR